MAGSLKNAYTSGKLVVRTIESDNNESMIDEEGTIIPYVEVGVNGEKWISNFGQQTFAASSLPTGFNALCAPNLPKSTIGQ